MEITRSIEVDAPVEVIHQEWLRFEELPRCAYHSIVEHVRWRAEVLTFAPTPTGTRITLRVEYDPRRGREADLPRRIEGVLRSFKSYVEHRVAPAMGSSPA